MRESYLLALCLTLAGALAAICLLFVRRERVLRHRLTRDEATGVLSQRELQRRARAWLVQAEGHARRGAFFLVRFEQYAEISAMLRAGEDKALLALVAQRLSLVARALGGIVGRCGLDTFTVCVPDVDEQGAAQVSTKLLEDLGASYELGGRPLIAVFRVGAALYPEHGRTVEELQRCVQVSMVPLKEREGPGWNMFDFRLLARQRDRQGLENDLRLALTTRNMEQFELYYQPVCDSASGLVEGCEALLRWHHPVLGSVSPAVTIELAERSGLIVPLGAWILERACSQATQWPAAWRVHVNLSVKQMNEDGLVQLVADVLAETKLAARKLVLEVTESIFILHYERHVKILNTLRAKGIGVALDDFGCGYSSLNHLRHLPIDWVKIDRSFISALESDAGSREVVSALFGLCQAMHLPVVAEGVETEGQREILKALGCRVMQGFLLGRPAPAAEIQALASAVS
ncbi:putative bifunctional diguanylate cyclase/phosphodiesterase [Achromobacter sp. 413638]|uniref:putative bifunctional diguanylate cyclase/phosphodiesterase n=1 Tax=Achromobacter sp. 413638 TaxID=3342385 RepID=UPI00370CCDDE